MLVHGLGGAAGNWLALAPLLLPGRRLIVPELPGHGGSEPLPAAPSLSAYADRLALLLDEPLAAVGRSPCGWRSGGRTSCRRWCLPARPGSRRARGGPATASGSRGCSSPASG